MRMRVLQGTTGILVCSDNKSQDSAIQDVLLYHTNTPKSLHTQPQGRARPHLPQPDPWQQFQGAHSQSETINISPLESETKIGFPKAVSNQTRLIFKTVCGKGKQSHFSFPSGRKGHSQPTTPMPSLLPVGTLPKANWERLLAQIHRALALLFPACCFFPPVLLGGFSKVANFSRSPGCRKAP